MNSSQVQALAPMSPAQAAQFVRYYELLVEWNAKFNLTAITDEAGVLARHFADSLSVLPALPPSAKTLLDVGTGAGFPGIPIKIMRPELDVTLMDSTQKKLGFCDVVTRELGLAGIRTAHARAEEAAHDPAHRERYDAVVARAVAAMPTLAEYILPFVKVGGVCVAMKGSDAREEAAQAGAAITLLGGKLARVDEVTLANLPDKRALVVIAKLSPSPAIYPRQGGKPRSQPL